MFDEIISRVLQDDINKASAQVEEDRYNRELIRAQSEVKVFNTSELVNSLAGATEEVVLDSKPTDGVANHEPIEKTGGFPAPPTST